MKNQNFYMRVLCLILIVGAIVFYNSNAREKEYSQKITDLTERVDSLESQQTEMLSALQNYYDEQEKAAEEASKAAEEAAKTAESESAKNETEKSTEESTEAATAAEGTDAADNSDTDSVYKNGTYTGEGQGFGGTIQVQITIEDDTLTDIQVLSAPGEDSAYLSQGKAVIDRVLEAQSTDVDTVSGATFSSTGILIAVEDALGKAEN